MAWLALPPCASGISSTPVLFLLAAMCTSEVPPCWAWLALPACSSSIPRAPVLFLFPAMCAGEAHARRHWQKTRADGPKREELTKYYQKYLFGCFGGGLFVVCPNPTVLFSSVIPGF